MTREDIQCLIDSGHEPTENVAHAIIAAANVGPTTMQMSVDNVTLGMIARVLQVETNGVEMWSGQCYQLRLSFLDVHAIVYMVLR